MAAGEWSNKFSLDAAGSGGDLKITKDGKPHEVSEQFQQVLLVCIKSMHISLILLNRCFYFKFPSRSVRRSPYPTSV